MFHSSLLCFRSLYNIPGFGYLSFLSPTFTSLLRVWRAVSATLLFHNFFEGQNCSRSFEYETTVRFSARSEEMPRTRRAASPADAVLPEDPPRLEDILPTYVFLNALKLFLEHQP